MATRLPIWVDEAFTFQQSSLGLGSLVRDCLTRLDAVHLTYYLICWSLGFAFDQNLLTLRLLSILATLGTIRNLFYIMHTRFTKSTSLIAAGVFAVMPVTVDFATQARSSSLVTLLFSTILLIAIKHESNFKFPQLLQVLVLSSLIACMNFLSLIGYTILAVYIFASNKVYFARIKNRFSLFLPFAASIPFVILGQRQISQIRWIGSENSFQDMIFTVLFWPLQGDNNNVVKLTSFFLGFSVVSLVIIGKRNKFLNSQNSVAIVLSCIATLPPLILLVTSLLQPIFLTRYFGYSALGISAVVALSLTAQKSNIFRFGWITAFVAICFFNISTLAADRDGQVDWTRVSTEISRGPANVSLVLNPSWSSPLARYYLTEDESNRIIGGIPDLEDLAQDDCSELPNDVWFVSSFQTMSTHEYQQMKLLGYRSTDAPGSAGPNLFTLENCN
jgi:uncharacterized membrane protein